MSRARRGVVVATALVVAVSCTGPAEVSPPGTADTADTADSIGTTDTEDGCDPGHRLTEEVSSGAVWSLCWQVDRRLGLVMTDIAFAPPGADAIDVIESIAIAQLEVPYDSGERLTSDITQAGFGGHRMHTLTDEECAGELLSTNLPRVGDGSFNVEDVREVLCVETVDQGLAYRSHESGELVTARRADLRLSTISKVGWYEYISTYTFGSDGSIAVDLGATGDLSPADYTDHHHGWPIGPGESDFAASHAHNGVWRVHWSLGGSGGLQVEQYDAEHTGEWGDASPILDGSLVRLANPTTAERADRRWWRVLAPELRNADDHPISYEISLGVTDSFVFADDLERHGPDVGYDVAFTNHDECAVYATHNTGRCGRSVVDFVAATEADLLDDVVSWVAVGFHHVVRDEDQSPMGVHWQGFELVPRDLTAQRVDVPPGREDVNGEPDESPYLD